MLGKISLLKSMDPTAEYSVLTPYADMSEDEFSKKMGFSLVKSKIHKLP